MRLFFVFSLVTVVLAAADRPVAKAPGNHAKVMVIPAGATEAAPNLYRYTDADGKIWLYRQTPFGVVRFPDQPVAAPKDPAAESIRAIEDGDAVRFERLGPFGTYHWRRNKTELDPSEQAAWDKERARAGARQD